MVQNHLRKSNKSKIFLLLLGVLTIIGFFYHVYSFKDDIFKKFDGNYWTDRYNKSQWIVKNSKLPIGDDGLYIYAGYRYMLGDDPSLLNAELPPFGKYLVGLFEVTTGYLGIFSVFFSGLFLISLFLLSKKIFQSSVVAMLGVAIFSFEPLFYSQIRAAYLDTTYGTFLVLGLFLFLNKKYILAGIALGLFMSIKSPFLIAIVYIALISWLILQIKFNFKHILSMIVPTILIFMLSYTSTFLHGHGLIYFLKVQKYIIHFYSVGAKPVVGAVFPMIINGTWFNWFGPVQRVSEWIVLWPLSVIGTIFSIFVWIKKRNQAVLVLFVWLVFYLSFLTFTPVFSRYLLLVIPFMYNLSIWSLYVSLRLKFHSSSS